MFLLLAGVRLLVIVAALVLAAGGSALAEASAGAASGVARGASNSVAVFGGGVAGLTAAHELAERGFVVTVYEATSRLGGKAVSFEAAGTRGPHGERGLPAEHGFRIFSGEYGAVRDTLRKLTAPDGRNVEEHLVLGTRGLFAAAPFDNSTSFVVPGRFPRTRDEAHTFSEFVTTTGSYLGAGEGEAFAERILYIMTSCMARRYKEFEGVSWWDFMLAEQNSAHYGELVKLISGNILAANPYVANAHVVGAMAADMIFRLITPAEEYGIMNMLDLPTSEVWIDPWVARLRELGVRFVMNATLTSVSLDDGGNVTAASVHVADGGDGGVQPVAAEHYFVAIPAEKFSAVLEQSASLLASAPELEAVASLETAWMSGIQFYLRHDVQVTYGNIGFLRSPWALAGVSQAQFRPALNLTQRGDGSVRGVLSMTISNWTTPGLYACKGLDALQCGSRERVLAEAWAQVKAWLPDQNLTDDNLVAATLDPAVAGLGGSEPPTNWSPLLINTAGSWAHRPTANRSSLPNLYLAADFVRAPQNVACMETASQAARLAVNALLDRLGSPSERCGIYPTERQHEGEGLWKDLLLPLRADDEARFNRGEPHRGCECPACMPHCESPQPVAAPLPEQSAFVDALATAWRAAHDEAQRLLGDDRGRYSAEEAAQHLQLPRRAAATGAPAVAL